MNNQNQSRMRVFAVLIAIVLVCGTIFCYFYFKKAADAPTQEASTQTEKIPEGWMQYKNDVLGISFAYPTEWGNPEFQSGDDITHLSEYSQETDFYPLTISFSNPEQKETTTPQIILRQKYFEGENVCDHKRSDFGNFGVVLDEVYASCTDKVKTFFIRTQQVHDGQTEYEYTLEDISLLKLQNGFYNDAYISYFYDSSRIKESNLDFQDFMSSGNGLYQRNHAKFVTFVNSLKAYQPVLFTQQAFKVIPNEDANITIIRRYYYEIAHGNLPAAYDMYLNKPVAFTEYTEWYKNTFRTEITDIEKLENNQYQFKAEIQDKNQQPVFYRVKLEIKNGKIIPVSSEEIKFPTIKGNLTAFVSIANATESLILSENNKESIISKTSISSNPVQNIRVSSLEFSPSGNYLLVQNSGWEWGGTSVYDIKNKKWVLDWQELSLAYTGFTPDEKYFYACASSGFDGTYYGVVYQTPNFGKKYSLPAQEGDIKCSYNAEKKTIQFTQSPYSDSQAKEVVEFSTITGTVK